ncbi:hypothetical protein Tco_0904079 [Tanacetum coccineum]
MSTSNQQTLADSGANERPPTLENGNYIPWKSRFRRFLDNKLKDGDRMWRSIEKGPYVRPMIPNPDNPTEDILEPLSKMTEGNKKQYIADVKVMNYLLQAIPNDIYNSVDGCKNAKDMWEQIKRLMFGSDVTSLVRHSRLMDEFDKFTTKEGELLESVYERLTTLVNIMDHNNVLSYDVLYDSLIQFELHVLASKAKKAAKNHDPLALLAHSNASSSQSHANSSYSPQPYYVTHPSSVVDYEDEYQIKLQGDSQEDKLTTAMMLLAKAITQKFSTPTNNRLRTSSNTRNQAVIQDGRVDIQPKNASYGGNGLESKVMRECCFVVKRDAWLRGEFTLSLLNVLQGFSFFLQMGFTLILATLDGLDVGLLGDVIGEDDCDDDGPFELGTTRNTLGTTPEVGVLLGPERPRTYEDLSDTEKKRYDADVRATNIVLQGLPKDIYKLINYNIKAKEIWDDVKMLLVGSELTKEDRESQLYDEFERFKMLPGENINEYYVRFHKLVNDMRNIRMTMPSIQLNSKFVNNMSPEWDRFVTSVKLNKD